MFYRATAIVAVLVLEGVGWVAGNWRIHRGWLQSGGKSRIKQQTVQTITLIISIETKNSLAGGPIFFLSFVLVTQPQQQNRDGTFKGRVVNRGFCQLSRSE
jgi:hypothetical protein